MISKRIKELGDMIKPNSHIIDVGCDHGLLDIYLVQKSINITCLATDISQNALNNAINNIKENNLEEFIETKKTNGLDNIAIKNTDIIVISGMGTNTIINIIKPHLLELNHLFIQSNRDIESLREFMLTHGFTIIDEKITFDERYYITIEFIKNNSSYNDEDIWLGPIIKDSQNIDYFNYLLGKENKIMKKIPDNDIRKKDIEAKIEYLKKIINC